MNTDIVFKLKEKLLDSSSPLWRCLLYNYYIMRADMAQYTATINKKIAIKMKSLQDSSLSSFSYFAQIPMKSDAQKKTTHKPQPTIET